MRLDDKLTILADAAKYDVSCASSGSRRRNTGKHLGNAAPSGICHTYTEDGRCVSLLKILYTNFCIYDCAYCINRTGNDIPRAAFTTREVVGLTTDFYRRNYIEGLFLSSGVQRSPDDTMERLVRTVQELRKQGFNGYIHLKCVPYASRRLIRQAGRFADRLSVNIELPSDASLQCLTNDKTFASVLSPMGVIREAIAETREDRKRLRHVPAFAPAGQSTQMIVGASPETDYDILDLANDLYRQQALKRVYYTAYIPLGRNEPRLPSISAPPLKRENRLYQADWLMRLYGFDLKEVIDHRKPHLDLDIDPKQAYALRHPERFPVDVNNADHEAILRVPGIGLKSARRIISLRRRGRIRLEHLKQLGVVLARARPFIHCDGLPRDQWLGMRSAGGALAEKPRHMPAPVRTARAGLHIFETDGSFEGLLCALFASYTTASPPDTIEPAHNRQAGLFDQCVTIPTDPEKSERVWQGLGKHLGGKQRRRLFEAFLSGRPGVETIIYRFTRHKLPGANSEYENNCLSAQINIDQLAQKVRREAHRLKGFIRFQLTGNDQYLALIAPRYDVLPLIRRHFEARFADQNWVIYDMQRNYGLCYDQHQTRTMTLAAAELEAMQMAVAKEHDCQTLWRRYFAAANISQRNNPKLHLRQLPRRFWRYLPEKQGGGLPAGHVHQPDRSRHVS